MVLGWVKMQEWPSCRWVVWVTYRAPDGANKQRHQGTRVIPYYMMIDDSCIGLFVV